MRSEFNKTGDGPQRERALSAGTGVEGGNDALGALDRLFGSGRGAGPQDSVASDGPDHEAPPPAGESVASGQDSERRRLPQQRQPAAAHRSGSTDGDAEAVAVRSSAPAGNPASDPDAEAGHEGDERSSVGGGAEPEDRGSVGSGSQFEVVHPDDPGFLEEFGAVKDAEQGIFDWFALETRDPLDVEDDMFSEAADLPGKLADRESGRRRSEVVAADRHGDRSDAMGWQSSPDRFGSEAARRGGLNGSGSPGETNGTVVGDSGSAAGSGSEDIPSGEAPEDHAAGNWAAGRVSSGAPGYRGWSVGWPRRGLAVVALAVVGGVALMQLTGDAGLLRTLESAISGTTGPEFGNVPAPLPGNILANRSQVGEERTSDDVGKSVRATGRMDGAVPSLAAPTVSGDSGRFRLQLVPVDLNAGGPLPEDAPEMVEWDRLFSLLGKPVGSLSVNLGSDTEIVEARAPEAGPETADTGSSARPSVDFTADDGFGFAASDAPVRSESPAGNVEFLGPALPPAGVSDSGGAPSRMPAVPAAELARVNVVADGEDGTAMGFEGLAERVAGLERRLAAVNRNVDELRMRKGAAVRRRPEGLSLSPFVAPEGLAEGLEADAEGRDAVYVIRSGKGEAAPIAALTEVKVGDRVDGFGEVLDIAEYGDGGRLLVMEKGSVYLN